MKRMIYIAVFLAAFCHVNAQLTTQRFDAAIISSFQLQNVQVEQFVTADIKNKPLTAFVFLSPECPLCRNYTKTINQLQQDYHQQVQFIGIIPGKAYSTDDVKDFIKKYRAAHDIMIDREQKLTHYLQATVTPQVILLDDKATLIYTGAIDDWAQSLGKQRLQASQHYLENAINQSLKSAIVKIKKTEPVGCKINDY